MSHPPDAITTDPSRPQEGSADVRIMSAMTRLEAAIEHKPGFGRSITTSSTTLIEGLRCVSEEGGHRVETDLTPALGGQGSEPTPSALLRAALGSCLAMGYRLRAARRGIPVEMVRVEVETESAIGGMLDPASAFPPGFIDVRYRVTIVSPAPAELVEQVIDEGDRLSPVLDAVARANRVSRVETGALATHAASGGS
jgi:uncharacterized OsmC-like protein